MIDKNGNKCVDMFNNAMFKGRGRLILYKGDI